MAERLTHEEYIAASRARAAGIAQSVLDGRLSVLEGSRLIVREGLDRDDPDLKSLAVVVDETDALPIGEERHNWSGEALKRKAPDLAKAEAWAREVALDAIRNIAAWSGAA